MAGQFKFIQQEILKDWDNDKLREEMFMMKRAGLLHIPKKDIEKTVLVKDFVANLKNIKNSNEEEVVEILIELYEEGMIVFTKRDNEFYPIRIVDLYFKIDGSKLMD